MLRGSVLGATWRTSGSRRAAFHAVTGALLLAVLAVKVVALRWWHAAGRFLPVLGDHRRPSARRDVA
jgi:hypothetical protein